jgi:hypothetical protein
LATLVNRVIKAQLGLRDLWAKLALWGPLARPEMWEVPGRRDPTDSREIPERREFRVFRVPLGRRVRRAIQVLWDRPANPARPVNRGPWAPPGASERPVIQVNRATSGLPAPQAPQETSGRRDSLATRVAPGRRAAMGLRGSLDRQGWEGRLGRRARMETLALQGLPAARARREIPGLLGHQARLDLRAHQAQ